MVSAWLKGIRFLILALIGVGGATRLFGAGLSITEWKPVAGIVPPLNAAEWEAVFRSYQEIPQFRFLWPTMSLVEFKRIYFWEYGHRLLARIVGLAYLLPFLYFWLRGSFQGAMARRLAVPVVWIALQGFMGWYMVQSGLSQRTAVSHYRLAIHLALAVGLIAYIHWLILSFSRPTGMQGVYPSWWRPIAWSMLALVSFQGIYGALLAGSKGGYAYPTFPKMNGHWLHPDVWKLDPLWVNLSENPAMIQWIHRTMGWMIAGVAFLAFGIALRTSAGVFQRLLVSWCIVVGAQFLLGVFTLLLGVPVLLGVLHQLNATVLVLLSVSIIFQTGSRLNQGQGRLHG